MSLCPHGYTAFWDCPVCPEPMGTARDDDDEAAADESDRCHHGVGFDEDCLDCVIEAVEKDELPDDEGCDDEGSPLL